MLAERQAVYSRGPRFFLDGEVIRFEFVIDGMNKFGPFEATEEHKAEHPAAWAAFVESGGAGAEPESPLKAPVQVLEPEPVPDLADDAAFQAAMASPADFNGADPAAFDHDGDGRPGGSKRRKG